LSHSLRAVRAVVGVQEQLPAERAAPVLRWRSSGSPAERAWFCGAAACWSQYPVSGGRLATGRACPLYGAEDFVQRTDVGMAPLFVVADTPGLPVNAVVELAEVLSVTQGLVFRVARQPPIGR